MSKDKKEIKVTEFSNKEGYKIDIYDKSPREKDHKSIHLEVNTKKGKYKAISTATGEKEEHDGNCFLTTATMQHFKNNFNDNCYELNILRWFRDNFVSEDDIKEYYKLSPQIISKINAIGEKSKLVYEKIYESIIQNCINDIENQKFDSAYKKYKLGVLSLSEEFNINKEIEIELEKPKQLKKTFI